MKTEHTTIWIFTPNKSIIGSFSHLSYHLHDNTFVSVVFTFSFAFKFYTENWLPLQLLTTMIMDDFVTQTSQSLKPFVVHNTLEYCEWARLWFTALLMWSNASVCAVVLLCALSMWGKWICTFFAIFPVNWSMCEHFYDKKYAVTKKLIKSTQKRTQK